MAADFDYEREKMNNHTEVLAEILKRIAKCRNERSNTIKAALWDGICQLIDECGIEFLSQGWPLCCQCEKPADLAVREDDEAWCDRCWDKLSAEEQEGSTVRLLDLLATR